MNFHFQNQKAVSDRHLLIPSLQNDRSLLIKEITVKSAFHANLSHVNNEIKEALKRIRQQDSLTHKSADAKDEDKHLAEEKLVQAKGSSVKLNDLILRPAI